MDSFKLTNISSALTLRTAHKKGGRRLSHEDLDIIPNAEIVYDREKILWLGKKEELPPAYGPLPSIDCQNGMVTPEIVDCHTHLIFGGYRSEEHSMRLGGADYEEIAKKGGGILATMKATGELSSDELFALGMKRCERLHSYGVGTIEIKSGYGLSRDKEYEISHVIHRLKTALAPGIQIHNTFMAAHAVPPGFSSSRKYLREVVLPLLEEMAKEGILDSVDIFHERGYFDEEDVKLLFSKAKELGIPRRSHADEFGDNGGASLASSYGALSADHLLQSGPDGMEALARSETVATLLPGTGFFLGKKPAHAREFLDRGVCVAIGSDYNPGSCHFDNVLQIASMAAPLYGMNLAELWASITLNGARALGLKNQGAIEIGLAPRFSFFRTQNIHDISYFWGRNLAFEVGLGAGG
ncbi:MAG: imidazolonepropionase [Bacteriovoracales bacterium]|nr:imidazolonepropionase [Bacteriovoracales bacterium]